MSMYIRIYIYIPYHWSIVYFYLYHFYYYYYILYKYIYIRNLILQFYSHKLHCVAANMMYYWYYGDTHTHIYDSMTQLGTIPDASGFRFKFYVSQSCMAFKNISVISVCTRHTILETIEFAVERNMALHARANVDAISHIHYIIVMHINMNIHTRNCCLTTFHLVVRHEYNNTYMYACAHRCYLHVCCFKCAIVVVSAQKLHLAQANTHTYIVSQLSVMLRMGFHGNEIIHNTVLWRA